ncbi:Erv41 protein [Martiniozyma asiatica (nom. inval.)]|nr:Erv41 protein [Martiniozyma asiatica]
MDNTRRIVHSFDAFPKRPSQQQVRSDRGGFSSLLTYFFLIFMIWVEIGGYFDGYIDYQFSVDDKIRETVTLNVDIIVAMPCKYLDANCRDETNDRFLAEEILNFEGMLPNIPEYFFAKENQVKSQNIDQAFGKAMEADFIEKGVRRNVDLPFCRITGTLPINRLRGDFHITAENYGYFGKNQIEKEKLNFSHYISEFSFGTFYPMMENNLDMTYKKTDDSGHTFHYSLKVVPTVYKKLGAEVDTNQYSVNFFETSDRYAPGIFIKYEFDPIKMRIVEQRISFWSFLIKVITIIGSLWVVAQWAYKGMDKLIYIVLGEKFARRGEEKKEGGLLDEDPNLISI